MRPPTSLVYHQKSTLVDNISRHIREIGAQSLVDIGAGSLEVAAPIASQVSVYRAVEKDTRAAARLRAAGLSVIEASFPAPIEGTYDLVLSSHSIPEHSLESYSAFLTAAWNLTNPGGGLLIVTFKGSQGDLANVARELLGRPAPASPELEAVLGFYERTGGLVAIERVNSYVQAPRSDDIAGFLAPWISGREDTLRRMHDSLVRLLETRYKVRPDLYVFPTEHLFLSCRKP